MCAVALYRLSGLAVMIGMTIGGIASVRYSRAGGVALYRDPLATIDDLAKLFGSLIATFRADVYPRRAGALIGIGAVAAIVLAPLVSVPSGPFRLDRIGVLAAAFGFAWCGWYLLRHTTDPMSRPSPTLHRS